MRTRGFIAFLVLMATTLVAGFWLLRRERSYAPPLETERHREVRKSVLHNVGAEVVEEVLRIEEQEKQVAATVWAKEMLAQECGRTIEKLWDEINGATNKLEVLARFGVEEVRFGRWEKAEDLPHGIEVWSTDWEIGEVGNSGTTSAAGKRGQPLTPTLSPSEGEREKIREEENAGKTLAGNEWKAWVEEKVREGWVLEQIEFRQIRFEVEAEGAPARSLVYFAANLLNGGRNERVSIEGDLEVDWGVKNEEGMWTVRKVDASRLTIKRRQGGPVFELVLDEEVVPLGQTRSVDPLIVYDLDGDGLSEVILAAANLVFKKKSYTEGAEGEAQRAQREGGLEFLKRELCKFPEEFIKTAVMGDFDGDRVADFLCKKWEGLFLFKGGTNGVFEGKGRNVWKAEKPLELPMVMTCGDVDADGDLDLFIGQYKDPYEGGVTPGPFYDANDGYPAYLLINQGHGDFVDGTAAAGLGAKRNRRTFSASLVDLDRDEDLDLMVVSDFAGVDFYANEGKGRFTDVTEKWVSERHAFGMAHSLADFDNDGLLDVLMIGMTSPTMERLNHLRLMRTTNMREREMEVAMTYGNRLMFGKLEGGFEQRAMSDSIARAGWAWGCANLDFDGDGWEDVYIANGFQSLETVRDSEGDYWLHDRFLQSQLGPQATDLYFKSAGSRRRGSTRSFGGHERNRFYWNRGGTNFLEVGYLLGVSVGADSRNVLADDLDGDGRMDLVVVTSEVWPKQKQTLKIFQNALQKSGDGSETELTVSANEIGKVRTKEADGKKAVGVYATGGGFRSQGPAKVKRRVGTTNEH